MQKKQPHFVSASCRAQHPGNKKPANNAGKKPILLALVVVLNIPGKQAASKPCRKNSRILSALVVVLNILENKKPANHAEKTAPFC